MSRRDCFTYFQLLSIFFFQLCDAWGSFWRYILECDVPECKFQYILSYYREFMFSFQTFILSVVGVPSALLATLAVEIPFLGRKGTLSISAGYTFFRLFLST